jgi:D-alanyl-D-alanine carboxypeptidase/D-alanyl-D-alanine-endopeptidase (penicillin-binding protein 4)
MRKRALQQEVAAYAHIKTGSLEGVRAFAGYVRDQKGHTKAVVFFVNDPKANQCNSAFDALLEWAYTN